MKLDVELRGEDVKESEFCCFIPSIDQELIRNRINNGLGAEHHVRPSSDCQTEVHQTLFHKDQDVNTWFRTSSALRI